jgi:hypothetical protein
MDNCRGQNKNKYVLRLATLFVELEYYRRVNIIFLVAGHTKNAADRLFNLLKNDYRKRQVFTMEQLRELLDGNLYVECIKVGAEDFRDYGKFEDDLYKSNPLSGHTKKYQLFYLMEEEPGVLYGKESSMDTMKHKMDLKKGNDEQRKQMLQDFDVDLIDQLKTEGIRTIKQVELFTKWRKHVPDEYKSPLYDNPGDDVLQSIKDDRKNKKKYVKECQINKKAAVDATGIMAARKLPLKSKTDTRKR